MTVGIYILRFKNTDKVYIGQSKNIEGRYNSHCTAMRIGKAVKKLQNAFNNYGLPYLEILIECNEEELNDNEKEAIEIFNAVTNGFNTMTEYGHSSTLQGDACGNSKYSNELVREVFYYLTECSNITHKEIENITGMSRGAIADISRCETHKWLKEEYPDKYAILENLHVNRRKLRRTAESRGITYPNIISPCGEVYTITSIRGFAKEHKLNPNSLGRVLRGQNITHKGWKLK